MPTFLDLQNAGFAALDAGDVARARGELERALAQKPDDYTALGAFAYALRELNAEHGELASVYARIRGVAPTDVYFRHEHYVGEGVMFAWLDRVHAALQEAQPADARAALKKAIAAAPLGDLTPALDMAEARVAAAEGKPRTASRLLFRARLRFPEEALVAHGASSPELAAMREGHEALPIDEAHGLRSAFDAGRFAHLLSVLAERTVPANRTSELAQLRDAPEALAELGHERCEVGLTGPDADYADLIARAGADMAAAYVAAALAGAELLTYDACCDERAVLARHATTDGRHQVFAYERGQIVASWPSIAAWLLDALAGDTRDGAAQALDVPADFARDLERAEWVSHALIGVGYASRADDVALAAPAAAFASEHAQLAEHPHRALYWLHHHFVAADDEAFRRTADVARATGGRLLDSAVTLLDRARETASPVGAMTHADAQALRAALAARDA